MLECVRFKRGSVLKRGDESTQSLNDAVFTDQLSGRQIPLGIKAFYLHKVKYHTNTVIILKYKHNTHNLYAHARELLAHAPELLANTHKTWCGDAVNRSPW
jgi:hypothetical protein